MNRSSANSPRKAWKLGLACAVIGIASGASAQEAEGTLGDVLRLGGWDDAAWQEFSDGEPLTADETSGLLMLLRRVRSLNAGSIERWTRDAVDVASLADGSPQVRDHLVALRGRLHGLQQHTFNLEDAERFGFDAFFLADVKLAEGATATVLTADVPRAWHGHESLDEPVSFAGLFVKRAPSDQGAMHLVFLAPRIAWHPTAVTGANTSFGWAVLGNVGFDVGLLDTVSQRSRLEPMEREAFYQLLAASGRFRPERLVHHANEELSRFVDGWRAVAESSSPRQLLAQIVLDRASEGHYSVAPLFNEPANQVGNLVVLSGTARRAVRIDVAQTPSGERSDVWRRFGIDHYFELDVFTADSQNHPVIFCVRELPPGFPTGAKIHEPVQVAGFFLKSWLHGTRRGAGDDRTQQQLAPLLLSPGPLWLKSENEPASMLPDLVAGAVFVLAIVGIWGLVWWHRRGDRLFHDRTIRAQYRLPEGESLDDIISDTIDTPGIAGWSADAPQAGDQQGPHPPT